MKVCIIDDEKENRDILHFIISNFHKDITNIDEAANSTDALKIINEQKPDLVFLDIEMPDGNGFHLVSKLSKHKPEIIFCTAYNQFALRAIECSALAYILKPVTKEIIAEAIQKAKVRIDDKYKLLQYQILSEQLDSANRPTTRFLISNSEGMHIIQFTELICCEAQSNYTCIYMSETKKIMVSKTLKDIETILESQFNFIRIHQSYLININKIEKIIKTESHISVLMTNDMELPVSRNKKEELLKKIIKT